MKIRYKIKRWRVKWRRYNEKKLYLSEVQQKAYDTTIRFINDKNSELILAPISGKMIIKREFTVDEESENVFITLNKNHLHVVNGVFHYDIFIDDRTRNNITDKFNTKLERKINVMENHIKSNVITSLDEVVKKVNSSK